MNIGPLDGTSVGAAGSPLAQAKGSEVERAHEQLAARARQVYHGRKAAAASGVGEPDGEDHETTDRDADGRRAWERSPGGDGAAPEPGPSRDPSRLSGRLLDLSG
jgi:hypothetical protein